MCIACLQAEDQGEDGVLARAEDELGPVEDEPERVEDELWGRPRIRLTLYRDSWRVMGLL